MCNAYSPHNYVMTILKTHFFRKTLHQVKKILGLAMVSNRISLKIQVKSAKNALFAQNMQTIFIYCIIVKPENICTPPVGAVSNRTEFGVKLITESTIN